MPDFYLYADESGKFHKSDQVSFCGYLTHTSEWDRISMEWNSCRMAWDIPPIHMAEVLHPERPKAKEWNAVRQKWGIGWESRREEMLKEFAGIILHSHAMCVGAAVDAEYFRGMRDSPFKQQMKNPVFLAIHDVVMNSLEAIDRVSGPKTLAVVFDDDQEFATSCYKFIDELRTVFPIAQRIKSVCFVDDKAFPGVQAADMIAYEARTLLTERKTNPDVEPTLTYMALTRKMLHQPKIYTSQHLDILEANWNQSLG